MKKKLRRWLYVDDLLPKEAVEQNCCDGCFFCHDDTCYNPIYNDWADGFQRESEDRSDGKSIIFKEVKE